MQLKTVRGKIVLGLAKWFARAKIITKEDLKYWETRVENLEWLRGLRRG